VSLYFDDKGWLKATEDFPYKIIHRPTGRFNPGMHETIKARFKNRLQGTITHYDAMGSAASAARAMAPTPPDPKPGGASTHFVIDRNGDIHQLASICNRTWHAGFKRDKAGKVIEWAKEGGKMPLPNGVRTESPNQWFIGVDLSNWGWLTARGGKYYAHDKKTEIPLDRVYFDSDKKPWEAYTKDSRTSYVELMMAISWTLDISKDMHFRHSDTSPTRKVDPGKAFDFYDLLDIVYDDIAHSEIYFSKSEPLPLPWDTVE
jgi:N-acetyl-anhydromuramyl-L-alanine amidase AmpD